MIVLFMDDTEARHEIAANKINVDGYRTVHAFSAREAIEFMKQHRFDVAMLDYNLGGHRYGPPREGSGWEVACAIRDGLVKVPGLVVCHSNNRLGRAAMVAALASVVKVVEAPFSERRQEFPAHTFEFLRGG